MRQPNCSSACRMACSSRSLVTVNVTSWRVVGKRPPHARKDRSCTCSWICTRNKPSTRKWVRIACTASSTAERPFKRGFPCLRTGTSCNACCAISQTLLQIDLSCMGSGKRLHEQLSFFPTDLVLVNLCREWNRGLVPLSNIHAFSMLISSHELYHRIGLPPLLLNHVLQSVSRHLHCREWTQVKVSFHMKLCARLQRSHFAISYIQPALLLQPITHTRDDRQIHGVIGVLARNDFCGLLHSHRVQARKDDFELRQIGTMIFTVSQLQQSLLIDSRIATGCCGIYPHTLRLHIIDTHQLCHQFLLKCLPMR